MVIEGVTARGTDPYRNLAEEKCLAGRAAPGRCVLYLWRNDRTIVIGRNQDPFLECRAEEFLRSGGRIARRFSGGGAVYQDSGNLNCSVLFDAREDGEAVFRRILPAALEAAGISAQFNGRNDLLCAGRKISGFASWSSRGKSCIHCTLLVRADLREMAYYLTPDRAKLERNRVLSVASRVMNLSELREDLTVEGMAAALLSAAGAAECPELPEEKEISVLAERLKSKEWILEGRE